MWRHGPVGRWPERRRGDVTEEAVAGKVTYLKSVEGLSVLDRGAADDPAEYPDRSNSRLPPIIGLAGAMQVGGRRGGSSIRLSYADGFGGPLQQKVARGRMGSCRGYWPHRRGAGPSLPRSFGPPSPGAGQPVFTDPVEIGGKFAKLLRPERCSDRLEQFDEVVVAE